MSLYLSKALFRNKDYLNCKELLQRKMIEYPNDLRIKYNMAMLLYRSAQDIFNQQLRTVQ